MDEHDTKIHQKYTEGMFQNKHMSDTTDYQPMHSCSLEQAAKTAASETTPHPRLSPDLRPEPIPPSHSPLRRREGLLLRDFGLGGGSGDVTVPPSPLCWEVSPVIGGR